MAVPGNCSSIPRKYVRHLNGRPLMNYAIETAKKVSDVQNICVLTDDEEVDLIAKRLLVNSVLVHPLHSFPSGFGQYPTLDILASFEEKRQERYNFVLWLSPSSPFLRNRDILEAVFMLQRSSQDAVFSVSDEPQREWTYEQTYLPSYIEIKNVPQNEIMHRETGAFFIMNREAVADTGYIGKSATPFFLKEAHALEINSFHEWWVAEKLLNRKQILFVVAGYAEIGMGHAYRALMLAQEFHDHEIQFLCTYQSQLAYDYISEHLYPVVMQKQMESLEEIIFRLSPDIVINDILDTSIDYILSLKQEDIKTINFEDQGKGSEYADLVINALYEDAVSPNMLSGYKYFCLRSEFLTTPARQAKKKVDNILVTFGGTDNTNLTMRILKILLPLSQEHNFIINIINGPGFAHKDSLKIFLSGLSENCRERVFWSEGGTRQISEFMIESDFAITSAGRTVHELAALKVPAIVIAANNRERLHSFAKKAGMCFLGIQDNISDVSIKNEILSMITDYSKRIRIKDSLNNYDLTQGKKEVVGKIMDILAMNDTKENRIETEP